ncbi:hypothetical protein EMEDMD4_790257 [Sinorhizobium medicae]|uniref:Uncharacterized protein n=1 Tax=Sinorhizobium medicae TaxID=110321 RepID=A0A508XAL5_9HYPH|nr:hypothetical protein EMEDMD4_790257 [Sinorhizobium medicae]
MDSQPEIAVDPGQVDGRTVLMKAVAFERPDKERPRFVQMPKGAERRFFNSTFIQAVRSGHG